MTAPSIPPVETVVPVVPEDLQGALRYALEVLDRLSDERSRECAAVISAFEEAIEHCSTSWCGDEQTVHFEPAYIGLEAFTSDDGCPYPTVAVNFRVGD